MRQLVLGDKLDRALGGTDGHDRLDALHALVVEVLIATEPPPAIRPNVSLATAIALVKSTSFGSDDRHFHYPMVSVDLKRAVPR